MSLIPVELLKDEHHKKYCSSSDTVLAEPIITKQEMIKFEVPGIINQFNIKYLDNLNSAKKTIVIWLIVKTSNIIYGE
jgi:hypothetical protein